MKINKLLFIVLALLFSSQVYAQCTLISWSTIADDQDDLIVETYKKDDHGNVTYFSKVFLSVDSKTTVLFVQESSDLVHAKMSHRLCLHWANRWIKNRALTDASNQL